MPADFDQDEGVPDEFRCGYAAIVGRPNVGKSTLLNRLVGQKVSITSRKPQTTRHQVLGIQTTARHQVVYLDTPGIHRHARRAINRYMNRAADGALEQVDVVLFMVRALQWTDEDDLVLQRIAAISKPVLLLVSQVDRVKQKDQLLPFLATVQQHLPGGEIIPVSATHGENIEVLELQIAARLPVGPPLFPEEQVTDRSERFLAAELVREKLTRALGEELPYRLTVEIERFKTRNGVFHIDAVIWVERESQKGMVIGHGGRILKKAGADARRDLESMLEGKVFLRTWVKVKENWSDDERLLRRMGYDGA
ncbi:MAG: GTPase Era [Gammaproteobacteria bacterium]|nr:GTPase Era [Gammaproteobacteria bacterium]